ncbi:MAG: hypothetical protein CVV64_13555 [Candidatus Wallbacteria bacterium HGW-Wallbacteria-1]|uniref:Prepilin-type N-terminal cleavage/methylation domain-containing protein n=1 Tax=Candidatus Wallbacteria bacterium HGW-Wallbacteria-1 TaxID=2013854 RepID=A0A2N1PMN2_9BACT|nr:MAG: hypothetical protein CVV64_13555 [Candidatus Wallbacteria bacterium HGW-Wallbacteria-1]
MQSLQFFRTAISDRHTSCRGFSFMELLVGIVIMSIALLPLLVLFSSSHKGTKATVQRALARNLCSDLVEFARSAPFDSISPASLSSSAFAGTAMPPVPAGYTRTVTVNNGSHNKVYTATSAGVTQINVRFDYKIIIVKTTWNGGGNDNEVVLSTIVVKK